MMEYVNIISSVGFPIFMALYLLVRFEKVIKENSTAVREMTLTLARLNGKRQ